jgi:hypothetical protein
MVLRISKTGWMYHEAPFTEKEMQERHHPASCPKVAIALERFEPERYALMSVTGDVHLAWCIKRDDGWYIEDRSGNRLAGAFLTLASAKVAAQQVLAHKVGASNPGW